MQESLILGSPQWLPVAASLAGLTLLALIWSLWRSPVKSASVWLSGLLKAVAALSVAAYLVEPMLRMERPQPGANLLAVAVDNSRSMEIHAPGQTSSLVDKLRPQLSIESTWQTRAAQDFSIRRYAFDTRLRAVDSFDELKFEGNDSAMGEAIETIGKRLVNRPSAGLIVFTDGMNTDSLPDLSQINEDLPLYPVVDIGRSKVRDVSILDPAVAESAFEIAPVRVEATIAADGLADRSVVVRLMNEAGETLESQTLVIDQDPWRKRVQFQYKPKDLGIQFVRLRAMLSEEDNADELSPPTAIESTVANNSRLLAVDRGGGPYRILYVAGRPNWEFKYLKRALDEDAELDCDGIIRIAKNELKFNFRDRNVDSTNPLFAGFDNAAEDATEQYDESIYIPIGAEEGDKNDLKLGFPKTEENLFLYDAVILDDVEAKFFTQSQMLMLRQFVAERGGSLLMLAGQETFENGGYRDTPIGDLLPVYLRGATAKEKPDQTVTYRLTREGALEPWARLRGSQSDEAKRISEMPPFMTWNLSSGAKPGASIIANLATDGDKTYPGLVTQSFGNGQTAAFMVGDMWRWGMRRVQEKNDDLAQSWRQLARWMTADVPKRLEVTVEPAESNLHPVSLVIEVRDEKFQVIDNAVVNVEVLQPDGKLVASTVTPDRQRPGTYLAKYWSSLDGAYVASVTATAPDGSEIGEREVGWTAEPSAAEFRNLSADLTPLREMAERSGGQLVDIDELDEFVRSLPTKKVPITEQRIDPIWHRTSWLLLTILCLCAEWGIRRIRGLP